MSIRYIGYIKKSPLIVGISSSIAHAQEVKIRLGNESKIEVRAGFGGVEMIWFEVTA